MTAATDVIANVEHCVAGECNSECNSVYCIRTGIMEFVDGMVQILQRTT